MLTEYLQFSNKILASKQASKQASKHRLYSHKRSGVALGGRSVRTFVTQNEAESPGCIHVGVPETLRFALSDIFLFSPLVIQRSVFPSCHPEERSDEGSREHTRGCTQILRDAQDDTKESGCSRDSSLRSE